MKLLIIILFALFQALYDYLFWNIIFHESDNGSFTRKLYRVCKEIIDIPVTWYLMTYQFVEPTNMPAAFFVFKLFGGIDGIYICIWWLLNPKKSYTKTNIYWFSYTPLGLFRTRIKYNVIIEPDEINFYIRIFGKYYIKKGLLDFDEFFYQVIFGTLASIGIIIFL